MAKEIQANEIHEAVRDRYGKIASTFEPVAQASCCGPAEEDCGCADDLYDVSLLADLPADVTGLSLGCGDPVTLASLEPGKTVLDLGSGGGIDVFLAARQVGPEGRVIGVDMTDEMLAKAEANKAKLGEAAANTEFRKGFIEALPVEDDTVDVIISNCVINLSPDKPQVFREAFRALAPGGQLAVSDIVIDGQVPDWVRANMTGWAACITGAISSDDYLDAIRAAGFVDVKMTDKNPAGEGITGVASKVAALIGPRIYSARVTASKPIE